MVWIGCYYNTGSRAQFIMMASKWPLELDKKLSYKSWWKVIKIWCKLTGIFKKKQAFMIRLSLDSWAMAAISEIKVSD